MPTHVVRETLPAFSAISSLTFVGPLQRRPTDVNATAIRTMIPPVSDSDQERPQEPDVHDSLLTGYSVDGRRQLITLHTEPHPGGGVAFIDVVFRGVVAYHFEGDTLRNIVSEILEVGPETIVGSGKIFAERHRLYGWPRDWQERIESAVQFFQRVQVKLFNLHCSYGMAGWIAASSVEYVVKQESGDPVRP